MTISYVIIYEGHSTHTHVPRERQTGVVRASMELSGQHNMRGPSSAAQAPNPTDVRTLTNCARQNPSMSLWDSFSTQSVPLPLVVLCALSDPGPNGSDVFVGKLIAFLRHVAVFDELEQDAVVGVAGLDDGTEL